MLIVKVKPGDPIDRALKTLKRKFTKTGVIKELHDRSYFEKDSVKRRSEVKKAIYVQNKFGNLDD